MTSRRSTKLPEVLLQVVTQTLPSRCSSLMEDVLSEAEGNGIAKSSPKRRGRENKHHWNWTPASSGVRSKYEHLMNSVPNVCTALTESTVVPFGPPDDRTLIAIRWRPHDLKAEPRKTRRSAVPLVQIVTPSEDGSGAFSLVIEKESDGNLCGVLFNTQGPHKKHIRTVRVVGTENPAEPLEETIMKNPAVFADRICQRGRNKKSPPALIIDVNGATKSYVDEPSDYMTRWILTSMYDDEFGLSKSTIEDRRKTLLDYRANAKHPGYFLDQSAHGCPVLVKYGGINVLAVSENLLISFKYGEIDKLLTKVSRTWRTVDLTSGLQTLEKANPFMSLTPEEASGLLLEACWFQRGSFLGRKGRQLSSWESAGCSSV